MPPSGEVPCIEYDPHGVPVSVRIGVDRYAILPDDRLHAVWHCLTDALRRSPSRHVSQAHKILRKYCTSLPEQVKPKR